MLRTRSLKLLPSLCLKLLGVWLVQYHTKAISSSSRFKVTNTGVRYIGSKMLEDLHILHVNHELLVSIDALQLLRYLICVLKLWINATRQDLTDNSFQFFWLQKIHEL